MSRLRVPTISIICGEGGSGGALALAVADRVLILENALYFVITPSPAPPSCWRDAAHKQLAAEAMRISAPRSCRSWLRRRDRRRAPGLASIPIAKAGTGLLGSVLQKHLAELKAIPIDALVTARQKKFRNIAQFYTES